MIPTSTTITPAGRAIRSRLRWGAATVAVVAALAMAFSALDRSTVVAGPAGSSFATTATGVAALHDVLFQAGRDPARLLQPVTGAALRGTDTFLVADVGLNGYERSELDALTSYVTDGGSLLVLGQPPQSLLDAFDITISWQGTALGSVSTTSGLTVDAPRFGSFAPGHAGTVLASNDRGDLAVSFVGGSVVLVADSSIAHNDTIDQADNIVFLGDLLGGVTIFDDYRHGYDTSTSTGLLDAAPGNWRGAALVGTVVLLLVLVAYGRRFGPAEPQERELAPDRGDFVDSVTRRVLRTGGPVPRDEIRLALTRALQLPPDADDGQIMRRARAVGATVPDDDTEFTHDHLLAEVLTGKGRRP